MEPDTVRIPVDGKAKLHAWLFRPPGTGPFPAITMANGFGGLKYHGLRPFAEHFRQAGFVVLAHDHRGFGLSDGEPRNDIDPWRQVEDWRRAVTYLETTEGVDPARLGLWGTSFAEATPSFSAPPIEG
jgi:dienelactone hydrolase